jgi:hypothetical protein
LLIKGSFEIFLDKRLALRADNKSGSWIQFARDFGIEIDFSAILRLFGSFLFTN